MATLIKSDHMVSVYLLSFKISNHKYAILGHMTFLFILKWTYESNMTISLSKWPYVFSKWPYNEFGVPYNSFMVTPHPQCSPIQTPLRFCSWLVLIQDGNTGWVVRDNLDIYFVLGPSFLFSLIESRCWEKRESCHFPLPLPLLY